ncbi:HAD family hydrolase [Nocardia yunnanensis]|uniref:HAD family hydrolase n=1 Tax=Nocardia yunnanensis TaxID=2382165 RepID=A0A386ZLZ9_9NOCA|nr:haloacid dehalogenase-like hydrolase [Nocardia yunnanensis]AYF78892.1 HAD family hydrolase [Nocardia yunnanensis]
MSTEYAGLVVWDVDGTLIPADLRWLRRAIARTYTLPEAAVTFPSARVHGYTDESIVVDTAVTSGISPEIAEQGVPEFHRQLARVMEAGEQELAKAQPAYLGAAATIAALDAQGFVQTVLTGNLRPAAELKLRVTGLSPHLDLDIGAFGSDARNRFELPEFIAKRFAAKYGNEFHPSRTVVIGDAPNDIACARHAGLHAIVVTHRATRSDLAAYSPDAIIDVLQPDTVVAAVKELVGHCPERPVH